MDRNRTEEPSYVIKMTERVIYSCGYYESMDSAKEDLKKLNRDNINPFKTYCIEKEWDDDNDR